MRAGECDRGLLGELLERRKALRRGRLGCATLAEEQLAGRSPYRGKTTARRSSLEDEEAVPPKQLGAQLMKLFYSETAKLQFQTASL